ncbi:MAG: type IV pilus twitching motility protein PilT [Candidatus Marinimicrobia bacterium]|nr:type IV pilus twitching motility protein PilT [Candidatus Neomarinimicrobiota bacterium]MCH7954711.1 type IV pilus twitching motility protein PilT [Candidatus Neomarinimicrobiota bacterium]
MEIFELLKFAVDKGGSDLHLSVGAPPMLRLDGKMKKIDSPPLEKEEVDRLIYDVMTEDQRRILEETMEVDFSRELSGIGRFRINVFYGRLGKGAVLRVINSEILSFEKLGLPPILKDMSSLDNGLILVTGPTGSGKSTTLATMIDYINSNFEYHLITIEDPIEFIHTPKKSLINQRELHTNTLSFSNALRSSLREDPDVILVGELRDLETTSLAITAAETGHLVFGTLHTNSAAKTVNRIIDQYPAEEQSQVRTMLAESLRGVVAQILLPKKGGGRVGAFEILICTPAASNMIREDKIFQLDSIIQTSMKIGMVTMDQSLANLIKEGLIEPEDAYKHARDAKSVAKLAGLATIE